MREKLAWPSGIPNPHLIPSTVGSRDRGAPNLGPPAALPPEQRLIDPHSPDFSHPRGVGFQQCLTPAAGLVVHRMPPTAKFFGNGDDRATLPADLGGCPPGGPRCQQRPRRSNSGVLFDERPGLTPGVRARTATFPPPQPHRPAERRQIHQHNRPQVEALAFAGDHVEDLLTVAVEFCRPDTVYLRQLLDPLWAG